MAYWTRSPALVPLPAMQITSLQCMLQKLVTAVGVTVFKMNRTLPCQPLVTVHSSCVHSLSTHGCCWLLLGTMLSH